MNDDRSPTDRGPGDPGPVDDDLVSAVLDGEATPAERALVEGSAEGRRRLEELRAAAAAVAEPVAPLASNAVDAMVARAVADAATPVVVAPGRGPDADAASVDADVLGSRRSAKVSDARWRRALGAVAAVAAVVVLVAGVAALVRATGGRSSSDSAASSSAGSTGETSNNAAGARDYAAPVDGPVPPDLGRLADAESVLDRYSVLVGADLSVDHGFASESAPGGATASQEAPTPVPQSCPVPPVAAVAGERWSVTADAQLPDGPALVMSNGLAPGSNRVLVVDATTCAVLAGRTI